MTDRTADAMADTPPQEASSTALQIAVLAGLASMGTLATNILLPSLPQMAVSLKVTTPAVTASITVFLLVFALGQLLVGPISDRYGRRMPVLAGFAVFIIGSIWCGVSTDLPSLLIGRAIQAVGACSTSVLSRAIARDLFSGAALARALTLVMIAQAAALVSPRCSAADSIIFSDGAQNLFSSAPSRCCRRSAMSWCSVKPTTRRVSRSIHSPSAQPISSFR
jgi:DHA1 family bicyclomycin/chloramphenicol resistance-like MFS transporter